MAREPLVSIVIPTLNSEKTLPLTLESIKRQTYKNIEVIVVDSYSQDNTVKIARRYGAKILLTRGGLLWARYIGHLYARGKIELLLDSDQILSPKTIEIGVNKLLAGYDMLILEEQSYKPHTLVQWLFYIDRKHVHEIMDLNPLHGVLLARMYKYSILDKAFKNIRQKLPLSVMFRLVSQDHAIIYYEAWNISNKVALVKNAVYHIEPSTLKSLVRKFYRYGKTEYRVGKYYHELAKKRTPRKIGLTPQSWISLLLWFLKAVPYILGTLASVEQ